MQTTTSLPPAPVPKKKGLPAPTKSVAAKRPVVGAAPTTPIAGSGVTKGQKTKAAAAARAAAAAATKAMAAAPVKRAKARPDNEEVPKSAMRKLLRIGGVRSFRSGNGALDELLREFLETEARAITSAVPPLLMHSGRVSLKERDMAYILLQRFNERVVGTPFDDRKKKKKQQAKAAEASA